MKFRYPITTILSVIIISATINYIVGDEYIPGTIISTIGSICYWWIIVIAIWKLYKKATSTFKSFLFELIDKIKE